jgi:hypothetical protein
LSFSFRRPGPSFAATQARSGSHKANRYFFTGYTPAMPPATREELTCCHGVEIEEGVKKGDHQSAAHH